MLAKIRTGRTTRGRSPAALSLAIMSLAGLALGSLIILTGFARASAADTVPSKGPIPSTAVLPGGQVDAPLVPDFVPVWGSDGRSYIGYVPKEYVLDPFEQPSVNAPPVVRDWPVYADDLKTLVGHLVSGRGFVPLVGAVQTYPPEQPEVGPGSR